MIVGGPTMAMATLRMPQRQTLILALAALTLLPLIALAVSGTPHRTRIVARRTAPTQVRRDEPAECRHSTDAGHPYSPSPATS
ncbi:hypothetical protein ACFV80_29745 [Streptomyces sp. NPDC059862]